MSSAASAAVEASNFASVATAPGRTCPACGSGAARPFYELTGAPVHQVRLVRSRDEAINCDRGDIRLCFCTSCGFVWNAAFDPRLMRYGEEYESTQAVSPTFNRFHERLARDLVSKFELRGKEVFDLGCGQGEFLTLLCKIGDNRGTGFDPVYRGATDQPRIRIVKDFYSETYAHLRPDFVCSKMTMEHIPDPARFLGMLRRSIGDRPEATVFVMIPEVTRILDLRAFWDIYYEHCSYFSPGSLARAFRTAGFDPIDVCCDYEDQYVLIAARPGSGTGAVLPAEESPRALAAKVEAFAERVSADQARWMRWLRRLREDGKRTIIWGGGSKGVAFLTSLNILDEIEYAIDINVRRHGTFIAGTGQQIMTPAFLSEYRPDVVIIMSPIYMEEITSELRGMGLSPSVIAVESPSTVA